jgi:hypothetical protein
MKAYVVLGMIVVVVVVVAILTLRLQSELRRNRLLRQEMNLLQPYTNGPEPGLVGLKSVVAAAATPVAAPCVPSPPVQRSESPLPGDDIDRIPEPRGQAILLPDEEFDLDDEMPMLDITDVDFKDTTWAADENTPHWQIDPVVVSSSLPEGVPPLDDDVDNNDALLSSVPQLDMPTLPILYTGGAEDVDVTPPPVVSSSVLPSPLNTTEPVEDVPAKDVPNGDEQQTSESPRRSRRTRRR